MTTTSGCFCLRDLAERLVVGAPSVSARRLAPDMVALYKGFVLHAVEPADGGPADHPWRVVAADGGPA